MLTTTKFRTHWVDSSGQIYNTLRDSTGARRADLSPVFNLAECREYIQLGIDHLPAGATPPTEIAGRTVTNCPDSVWYMHLMLAHPDVYAGHTACELARELTDDIPHYAERWRQPFVELRARYAQPPGAI